MTKAEFLKQENVPEFIKEIVASIPDDAEVNVMGMSMEKPQQKKKNCNCDRVYEDGVDISPYLEGIADRLVSLVDLQTAKAVLQEKI